MDLVSYLKRPNHCGSDGRLRGGESAGDIEYWAVQMVRMVKGMFNTTRKREGNKRPYKKEERNKRKYMHKKRKGKSSVAYGGKVSRLEKRCQGEEGRRKTSVERTRETQGVSALFR